MEGSAARDPFRHQNEPARRPSLSGHILASRGAAERRALTCIDRNPPIVSVFAALRRDLGRQ
jgi:hypothetical protein